MKHIKQKTSHGQRVAALLLVCFATVLYLCFIPHSGFAAASKGAVKAVIVWD